MIRIKRVYEKPTKNDGRRILVDRLWPRGLTKQKAAIDMWLKDIGPSTELRKWFGHDPKRWTTFQVKYRRELKSKTDLLAELKRLGKKGMVTLVYGAKDMEHNEALTLKTILEK
ncbi:MAG: DUF488 domain-containing protein [Candidatus Paceibacterota bacterium]